MDQSPRHSLSYVAPAQAMKHVPVNETFRRLDALLHLTVRSRTVSAEPSAPDEGDAYILPDALSGAAWGQYSAHSVAVFQDGFWSEIPAVDGLRAYVLDEAGLIVFAAGAWTGLSGVSGGPSGGAAQFGVNTSADETNRLSVKSDAALFTYDDVTPGSGDMRIKVNKDEAGDTASHLFQRGFSGRAEFGLVGNDDFTLKVSPDGAAWRDAFVIDKNTGDTRLLDRVLNLVGTDDGATLIEIDCEGASQPFQATRYHPSFPGPVFFGRKARGMRSSPQTVETGDTLLGFRAYGYDGSEFTAGGLSSAAFLLEASETHSASAHGGQIKFLTVQNGQTSAGERLRIAHDGALQMGGANTVIDKDRRHQLRSYSVSSLPSASIPGQLIYIADESGGPAPAFSDGTNWRRVTDRATVS
ncbi:MAG: DUF2793 domain-containing protein [Pseudomonadota bacterium]